MSRGMGSQRAIDAAGPIARMRGEVMYLESRPGTCFHFVISGPGGTIAVAVVRAQRIHGSLTEIAADHAGIIARVCAAPLAPDIAREIWTWCQWGTLRYFRIEGMTLTELDRLGVVRTPLVKGAAAGAMRARWRTRRKKSGSPIVPDQNGTANNPVSPVVPHPQELPGSGPAGSGVKESVSVRYLRRRAREKREQEHPPGDTPPGNNPGTAQPPDPPTAGGTMPPS